MTLTPEDRIRLGRQFAPEQRIHIVPLPKKTKTKESQLASARLYKAKHRDALLAKKREAYAKKRAEQGLPRKVKKGVKKSVRHVSPGSVKDPSWNGTVHTCCQSRTSYRHLLRCPLNSDDLSDLK